MDVKTLRTWLREYVIPPGLLKLIGCLKKTQAPVDPRRYWNGEDVESLVWNIPLFASSGLPARTVTIGLESRDSVYIDSPIEIILKTEGQSICQIGFAVCPGCRESGVNGFINDELVLSVKGLPDGNWQDVQLEIPPGQCTLRLQPVNSVPVLVSHPVVRALQSLANSKKKSPRAVIIIILDSLTNDLLSRYREIQKYATSIDSFFREALYYENAFSQAEWTYPSIYSLITGKTTLEHGCFERYLGSGIEPDALGTLAQELTTRGYVTLCYSTSKMFQPAYNSHLGFQRFFYQQFQHSLTYLNITRQAIFHLDTHQENCNFLLLDYFDTHAPYLFNSEVTDSALGPFRQANPQAEWNDLMEGQGTSKGEPVFSDKSIVSIMSRALARLHEIDLALSWLFSYLEKTDLANESIVLLMSDHGDMFRRGHQPLLCDSRTHVPLYIRATSIYNAMIDAPVAAGIDILPTILHLVDRSDPMGAISGKVLPPFGPERDAVISESAYEGLYQAAVRSREFVLHAKTRYNSTKGKVNLQSDFDLQLFERKNEKSCRDVKLANKDETNRLFEILREHLTGYVED